MARILVVDDEAATLECLSRVLRFGKHDVTAMSDADEAVRAARDRPFDLVVTDLVMPKVDGAELCVLVRSLAGPQGLPVLFVSGVDDEELQAQARFAGGAGTLSKPFHGATLLRKVREILPADDKAGQRGQGCADGAN